MSLADRTLEELSDTWVVWVVLPAGYFGGGYLGLWLLARLV